MKSSAWIAAAIGFLLLVGCAHSITIAPDLAAIDPKDPIEKIQQNVGYYISAEDRARAVITPGGGGDKVQYFPYRDLEPGLFKVLTNMFNDVFALKTPDDKSFLASKNITFVLIPKIQTNSSSDSLFTWPPTDFTVLVECDALSPDGQPIWQVTATGVGKAIFSELAHEFGLAGRRASEAALLDLQRQILRKRVVHAADHGAE